MLGDIGGQKSLGVHAGAFRSRFRVFSEGRKSGFRRFVTFLRPRAEAGDCEFAISGMLFPNAPFLTSGKMKGNTMPGTWICVPWAARVRGFPWRLETSGMESVARTFGTSKGSGDMVFWNRKNVELLVNLSGEMEEAGTFCHRETVKLFFFAFWVPPSTCSPGTF